ALRQWAKTRARLANTPDDEPDEQRKIRSVYRKDSVGEEILDYFLPARSEECERKEDKLWLTHQS
ncbi:MAG TPA: hypothetical protein PLY01_08345, partial [Caldisericia bacterium]|nr:hypothetical protein [Caldisericia bacterium]